MKQSLIGLSLAELQQFALAHGLPRFVGKQLCEWLYVKGVAEFSQMTNLSKVARASLDETCQVGQMPHLDAQHSVDGTIKYLFPTHDGHYVETVYIPDGDRATLCVSCQVGCRMGCKFCMTGRQGLVGNLTAGDILNQILALPERDRLTNIVFMGQGEPMDNLDAVLRATEVLTADWGWKWSPKRITVSSVGVLPQLQRFVEESRCSLAISLHHPMPAERREIMPAERAFSIEEVVALLRQYPVFCKNNPEPPESRQRRLSFEYIVFGGLNDTKAHADALLQLLRELDCRINLIRFHDIPDSPFHGASEQQMTWLRDYLTQHGLFTTIRASRGQDIYAACGLLSTKKQEQEAQQQD
ncbi:MAG: 23S rRNA (adenine(2503)-C(2))-methyltransferase RlmN [Bacteroidaceae bacterium]|nr:23S rRNA (adenine(2503)-C(2))-methyltransferase RlmN [Bacteroidaceae bacterium]